MIQNNLIARARTVAWDAIPAWLIHRVFEQRFVAMTQSLQALEYESHFAGKTENAGPYFGLVLKDGTKLISGAPDPNHIKITAPARSLLNIPQTHAKVLVDYVVRYLYPHGLTPVLDIPYPEKSRGGFHLQHRNLVLQSEDFDADTRTLLTRTFTPQPGWGVLDIGCFLGHGALRLSNAVGPTGRVLAVEAMPDNAEFVKLHLEMNDRRNVTLFNNAIWKEAKQTIEINATNNQANAIASDVIASDKKIPLQTTSISALTEDLGRAASLVSLTVNGAEVEALESIVAMDEQLRPERLIMPGWYSHQGTPRAQILHKTLEQSLGYQVRVTSHNFVMAWRV